MREIRTSGSMSGEGRRSNCRRLKPPRPSSTLPLRVPRGVDFCANRLRAQGNESRLTKPCFLTLDRPFQLNANGDGLALRVAPSEFGTLEGVEAVTGGAQTRENAQALTGVNLNSLP